MVNTGNGKGKTTAALGTALRAVGYGKKVVMIQFLKGTIRSGEVTAVQKLSPLLEIIPAGAPVSIKSAEDVATGDEHKTAARNALETAREAVRAGKIFPHYSR